jgi:hypothetical protein
MQFFKKRPEAKHVPKAEKALDYSLKFIEVENANMGERKN